MLRKSNKPYTERNKSISIRDKIENRLYSRGENKAPQNKTNPGKQAILEALGSLSMDDLVGVAERALSEFPDDPEAVHRLVDEFWAGRKEVEASEKREETTNGEYIKDLEEATKENGDFRRVLYTGEHIQLVLMSIPPGEEIGLETHKLSQFIRIEEGSAKLVVDDEEYNMEAESAVIIPEGSSHNIINTGEVDLKLYTIYSPPEHPPNTVQKTKDSK